MVEGILPSQLGIDPHPPCTRRGRRLARFQLPHSVWAVGRIGNPSYKSRYTKVENAPSAPSSPISTGRAIHPAAASPGRPVGSNRDTQDSLESYEVHVVPDSVGDLNGPLFGSLG